MYILNSLYLQSSSFSWNNQILKPLNAQFTDRQKKITLIVSSIFAILSASLLLHALFFKSTKGPSQNNLNPAVNSQEAIPVNNSPLLKRTHPINQENIREQEIVAQRISKNSIFTNEKRKVETINMNDAKNSGLVRDDVLSDVENNAVPKIVRVEEGPKMNIPVVLEKDKRDNGVDENDDEDFGFISDDELSDSFEQVGEEDFTDTKASKKANLVDLDGKLVSLRTFKCMQKLKKELTALGKTYGNAIDNGDCFWDAFAQGLNKILGKNVTIKELRQQVSDEIQKLDKGPDRDNWVKKSMKSDFMDTYEDYRDRVAYTCDELLKKGSSAIVWGQEDRDGRILCHLYKVNLTVFSAGCIEDKLSKMDDDDNFYSDKRDVLPNKPYANTVEIGLYPGHFFPVLN